MVKKSDTVQYVFDHLIKVLFEKHGWDKCPLVTKDSIITINWEGQPVKSLKI